MGDQLTLSLATERTERREPVSSLAPGTVLLAGFALEIEEKLLAELKQVEAEAPFRHMVTPGGLRMSVAMTNCGALGWVSDQRGYRYDEFDPERSQRWPVMPDSFRELAIRAADAAGFPGFEPDACLINRYELGARLTLHQDKNERALDAPVVSASLGLPAVFLFGGDARSDRPVRVRLVHGDVIVWGGPARLRYHGVLPIKAGRHAALGEHRVNLTFRKAG